MPWIKTPNGNVHVKLARPRKAHHRCQCGSYATLVCDWPVTEKASGTCDKPICKSCARSPDPDTDYCPFHRGDPPKTAAQMELEGIAAGEEAARILGVKLEKKP